MVAKEDDPASYWVLKVTFPGRAVKLQGGYLDVYLEDHPMTDVSSHPWENKSPKDRATWDLFQMAELTSWLT